jgi:hypothetical protein
MEKAKAYALSNDDINSILNPDTNIFTYPELRDFASIDDAFDALGRCIMLYPVGSPNSGHWVAMLLKGDTIEYFDPYGLAPEAPRNWNSRDANQLMGQGANFLTQLMKKSGYKVVWSCFPYQKESADIATCGRWAVTRLVCKDLNLKQFHKLVMEKSKGSPDGFATAFTKNILGK